jgi:AmmeMemoRadiSam system protein B
MTAGGVRRPAVAGYFYPAERAELAAAVKAACDPAGQPAAALAAILPHGSYDRAGALIGAALSRITIPRRCILIGPSHTGTWMPWSIMAAGEYQTPLGQVQVDDALADALRERCGWLEPDAWAQRGEHAIEVILPFLQLLGPADLRIVPIIVGSQDRESAWQLAAALADVIRRSGEPVLMIASTDLSHYEPQLRAVEQDRLILHAMSGCDPVGLLALVQEHSIRMCGDIPAACVLEAAKQLGACNGALAGYRSSADAAGDPDSVIGYASMVIR